MVAEAEASPLAILKATSCLVPKFLSTKSSRQICSQSVRRRWNPRGKKRRRTTTLYVEQHSRQDYSKLIFVIGEAFVSGTPANTHSLQPYDYPILNEHGYHGDVIGPVVGFFGECSNHVATVRDLNVIRKIAVMSPIAPIPRRPACPDCQQLNRFGNTTCLLEAGRGGS